MSVKDKYCTISPIYGIRKRETGEQNQRETVVGSGDEHVVPEGRGVGGGGKQARETEAQTSSHRTTGHRASCASGDSGHRTSCVLMQRPCWDARRCWVAVLRTSHRHDATRGLGFRSKQTQKERPDLWLPAVGAREHWVKAVKRHKSLVMGKEGSKRST